MITVVIPAYNEEKNVPRIESELLPVLAGAGKEFEVVVVDDGSFDGTKGKVRKLADKYECLRLYEHEANLGLGAAIRTGIDKAAGSLLITLDADFTFHPKEIPKLIKAFGDGGEVDCVVGSHLLEKGKTEGIPVSRLFLSRGVNYLYAFLFRQGITAFSSIFRLYKTEQLKNLSLSSRGFTINAEILFQLLRQKRRIVEVPVTLTSRIYGESKINNLSEIRNHLYLLRKILAWRMKGRQ